MVLRVDAQINDEKSANYKVIRRADAPTAGKRRRGHPVGYYQESYAKVCLNCTKEECTGEAMCFRKERDKRK